MNEKEELRKAKENLKASIQVVRRELRLYNKAVLNRNKAVLKNVGNDIVDLFNKLTEKVNISREKEESDILVEKQVKEESIKDENKEKWNNRILNFKNGIKQKVNSLKSGFGRIKNSRLNNLSLANIDVKLRSAFDDAQLVSIKAANEVVKGANIIKDNVSNFTSQQIANYYLNKMKVEDFLDKKRREMDIKRAEKTEFVNEMKRVQKRTNEHKVGMMEVLSEKYKTNDVQNAVALDVQEIMDKNNDNKVDNSRDALNLNPNKKQKVKSSNSKLGRVVNSILFNLRLTNIDSKLRNVFDNAQLFGIKAANFGIKATNDVVKGFNIVKDNVSNFTSEQIAKYTEWRISKEEERKHNLRLREAERLSNSMIKERTIDHKMGMMEALNKQEREQYDARHEEFLKKKQVLLQTLIEEKNKLVGMSTNSEELKPKTR